MSSQILVTGANGFIGQSLCDKLHQQRRLVRAAIRLANSRVKNIETVLIDTINAETDWSNTLFGVSVVFHLAARVHVIDNIISDPLEEFRTVNVQGTLNLARQSAKAGVRRFIFVSSIKVNGEKTQPGTPFTADDSPAPVDAYAISKREAEEGLQQIAAETGMEVVIIRPPLIYGPCVKANFMNMMRWLNKGIPLPLGAINNKRSLVSLDNLIDLLVTCVDHPNAANQTFLVSDGEDLSITELLNRTATALGKQVLLVPVPQNWLKLVANSLGKLDVYLRLCESLQVDITKTTELLGWVPSVSVDEALRKTAEDFLTTIHNNCKVTTRC
ncbi:MAG: SDR family oxidoreductase [Methylococcaceae bacterium]|nr:SDR family oxidoreductase [Methylococcaceae bacterium]